MVFVISFFFIIGSAVGSFLNVVIDRSARGESMVLGRSYCDYCRATLSAFDLVPVLSFLILRARCRYCRRPISWQYPLIEIITGFLFVLAFLHFVSLGVLSMASLIVTLVVICVFVVVAAVDFKFSLIPTTLLFAVSLLVLFYNYFTQTSSGFISAVEVAFALAFAFLMIIIATRGKGMGTGDVPLVFLIGLYLGFPMAIVGVFLAFLSGAFISIILLASGRKSFRQAIPFGPFLVFGSIVALFWGSSFLAWYLRLL